LEWAEDEEKGEEGEKAKRRGGRKDLSSVSPNKFSIGIPLDNCYPHPPHTHTT